MMPKRPNKPIQHAEGTLTMTTTRMRRLFSPHLLVWILWLTIVCVSVTVTAASKKKKKRKIVIKAKHLQMCDGQPSLKTKRDMTLLTWLLEASGESVLLSPLSPQNQAACWMLYKDKKQSAGRSRDPFLQRYALVTLYTASTKGNTTAWDWPLAADDPKAAATQGHWASPRRHECTWYGVECNNGWSKQVTGLHLGFLKLDGILPRELYLLSHLKSIDLHANDFQGVLPYKMLDALTQVE